MKPKQHWPQLLTAPPAAEEDRLPEKPAMHSVKGLCLVAHGTDLGKNPALPLFVRQMHVHEEVPLLQDCIRCMPFCCTPSRYVLRRACRLVHVDPFGLRVNVVPKVLADSLQSHHAWQAQTRAAPFHDLRSARFGTQRNAKSLLFATLMRCVESIGIGREIQ